MFTEPQPVSQFMHPCACVACMNALDEGLCVLLQLSDLPLAYTVIFSCSVQIWATMNNCAGVSRDVMLSQDALEAIVNKTLEQLRNPGLQCLNMVTTELTRITEECTPPEISRWFPHLIS